MWVDTDSTMANDFQEQQGYGDARILWGRIAILAAVILLVFFVGRWTAGDADAVRRELQASERRVTELEAKVSELEAQLQAQAAGGVEEADEQPAGDGAEGEPTPEQETGTEDDAEQTRGDVSRSYEVQIGDTLRGIAEQVYGDPQEWPRIAEANNLSQDNVLTVGTVLEIPPADS